MERCGPSTLAAPWSVPPGAAGEEALAGEFDLCVIDGPSLDRLRDRIEARKARDQPTFLPVLLVTSHSGAQRLVDDLSVDDALDLIDALYAGEGHRGMALSHQRAESLAIHLTKRRFSVEEVLSIALRVVEPLGEIHRRNVIHKDLNPANIVLNAATGEVRWKTPRQTQARKPFSFSTPLAVKRWASHA